MSLRILQVLKLYSRLACGFKKAFKRGHNLMNKINNVESANNSSTTNQETNANINS